MTVGSGNDSLIGLTSGQLRTGGAGDDTLIGDAGNDTLDGGTGNDYLQGDGGPDTYIFNRGYGQDVIYDYEARTTAVNVIQLGAGIAPSDVTVRRGGTGYNDVVLTIAGTSEQLTVASEVNIWSSGIQEIQFADGTVWTMAMLGAMAPTGTSGNDNLVGTANNDTMQGLAGDDTLNGAAGADIMYGGTGND